jgi:hypothetical protein
VASVFGASGHRAMGGARRCLLVACLLVVSAGAHTSTAATAADQAALMTGPGRQGLMGSTHIRQLKVGHSLDVSRCTIMRSRVKTDLQRSVSLSRCIRLGSCRR